MQGAELEIWHCNSDGDYDNRSNDFNQRGKIIAQ